MKKLFLAVFAALLFVPFAAGRATEAKGQTLIDSMVTSNINIRRRETVYKSRSHWRNKKKANRKKARKQAVRRHRSHRRS